MQRRTTTALGTIAIAAGASSAVLAPAAGATTAPPTVTTAAEDATGASARPVPTDQVAEAVARFREANELQGRVLPSGSIRASRTKGGSVVVTAGARRVTSSSERSARRGDGGAMETVAVTVDAGDLTPVSGGGLGFGVTTVASDCYSVTSPRGNWYESCYRKVRDNADGNANKDFWAYQRRISSHPLSNFFVKSAYIESGESGTNSDKMERDFDLSPVPGDVVTSNCTSISISVPLGSASASFGSFNMCDLTQAVDVNGWQKQTRYAAKYMEDGIGIFGYPYGAARTVSFAMDAKITQGFTPYWWDTSSSCWSNAGWGDSAPIQGCQSGR